MDPIHILIADDHPLFRDGLRALLKSVPDMQVIGEAATGDEVITQANTLQPDVILMDLKMPGLNGIEATRRILRTSPHMRILVITMFEDDDSVFAAIRAGARGYLLKGAVQEERCGPFALLLTVRPSLVRLSQSAWCSISAACDRQQRVDPRSSSRN